MNFGSTFSYLHPAHRTLPDPNPSTLSLQSATSSSSSTTHLLERERPNVTVTGSPPSTTNLQEDEQPSRHPKPQPKDFESAFASLSSSYGYGGQAPVLPRKQAGTRTSPRGGLFRGSWNFKGDRK
ncbi:hypothetical protein FIBSPDRAFT_1049069 [Athelia psychrophila]|uniref:Uncharacterized protein n=1 Tax=Athelia psychrophila TaxID=1759441 RepID=A0A166CUG4_9AGAM|nr:hypothetical protein FIBSPDRAFT_1049069 [Fibularhizoctonia sp. CBS 109695]